MSNVWNGFWIGVVVMMGCNSKTQGSRPSPLSVQVQARCEALEGMPVAQLASPAESKHARDELGFCNLVRRQDRAQAAKHITEIQDVFFSIERGDDKAVARLSRLAHEINALPLDDAPL